MSAVFSEDACYCFCGQSWLPVVFNTVCFWCCYINLYLHAFPLTYICLCFLFFLYVVMLLDLALFHTLQTLCLLTSHSRSRRSWPRSSVRIAQSLSGSVCAPATRFGMSAPIIPCSLYLSVYITFISHTFSSLHIKYFLVSSPTVTTPSDDTGAVPSWVCKSSTQLLHRNIFLLSRQYQPYPYTTLRYAFCLDNWNDPIVEALKSLTLE
jgi:hypothetical protein